MTEEELRQKFDSIMASFQQKLDSLSTGKEGEQAKQVFNHVKPCDFDRLTERVTANEATTVTLQATQAKVAEENELLKTEVSTLKATIAQLKNNSTGTDIKGDAESEQPKYLL